MTYSVPNSVENIVQNVYIFQEHIDECGQILERCPNRPCVAYVERKLVVEHLRDCQHRTDNKSSMAARSTENDNRFAELDQNVSALRTVLNEEIRQRHRLISDVGALRKQNQSTDDWIAKVTDVLAAIKRSANAETEAQQIQLKGCKEDIEQLAYQYKARFYQLSKLFFRHSISCFSIFLLQEVKEWRKELRRLLDHIYEDLEFRNNVASNIDTLFGDNKISVAKITALESCVEKLKEIQQNDVRSSIRPMEYHRQPSELDDKLASLSLEVKQMKIIVCETEEKCERLERVIHDTRRSGAKTRQQLRDFETHLRMQKRMTAIVNVNGNLIWRIDQFLAKLQEAKDTDTFIKSPLFCNEQYGYTLRVSAMKCSRLVRLDFWFRVFELQLDVALNGFGTWKDRNMLACLTVVAGEWDTLLPWPCKLQADIILRDQTADASEVILLLSKTIFFVIRHFFSAQAKDIAKTIIVKKRDATYEQNHYIFISHRTLNENRYLKNDALIFQVKIHSCDASR